MLAYWLGVKGTPSHANELVALNGFAPPARLGKPVSAYPLIWLPLTDLDRTGLGEFGAYEV